MKQASESNNLSDTFANESEATTPRRTPEEWRRIEKEQTERDARNRNSTSINLPKTPGV